jgi:hypothetical protein
MATQAYAADEWSALQTQQKVAIADIIWLERSLRKAYRQALQSGMSLQQIQNALGHDTKLSMVALLEPLAFESSIDIQPIHSTEES